MEASEVALAQNDQGHVDILVVGAGLAGVYLTRELNLRGKSVMLIESRQRIGGRIMSDALGGIDLGPAWFWPQHPQVLSLLSDLNIPYFEQYIEGCGLFETHQGVQHIPSANSALSYRVKGGWQSLIQRLLHDIPAPSLQTSTRLLAIEKTPTGVIADIQQADEKVRRITANQIVLALPPRLVAKTIGFTPSLDDSIVNTWSSVATWMASHAKAVIYTYDARWREKGQSGFAYSQTGPLVEIHDASDDNTNALFGFIGLNPRQREMIGKQGLESAIKLQIQRLYDVEIKRVVVQDWATEPQTATALDQIPPASHPRYGAHPISVWDDRVVLSSTESARQHGGYIEGALVAAKQVIGLLTPTSDK